MVIFVEDLAVATAHYRDLGFHVVMGGTHAGGLTRNALIGLADGTYLELLAFNLLDVFSWARRVASLRGWPWILRGRTPLDRRFLPRAGAGEGVADWAVTVPDLDSTAATLRHRGIELDGPHEGRRQRPDGSVIAWRMAFPRRPALPFFIEDRTARALRVPTGAATRHVNGIEGVATVTVHHADVAGIAADLEGITAGAVESAGDGGTSVAIGDVTCVLHQTHRCGQTARFGIGLRGPALDADRPTHGVSFLTSG